MASRALAKQPADTAEPDRTALPLWDGTQLSGLPWLRELEANEHLLDADVSYFLRTGAVVTSAAKTAVSSAEHAALLKNSIIIKQNYSVRNPPPDDDFIKLYAEIQSKIAADEAPFTGEAIKKALPATAPSTLPDTYVLSPDRIIVADLKLRNVLLSLITSRGRKVHYQQLTQSGITLLHQLIQDTKPNAGYYTQSPYTLQLKAQLAQLMKLNLSCPSQIEFDQIRDSIDEVNNQLELDDRLTPNQLCDHYLKLISRLKSSPLWLSLQVELRTDAVAYGDLPRTITCITRVLTTFISHEQSLADESNDNAGRALPAMETDKPPPPSRDPTKTGLAKKGIPKTPCPICKKMHWKYQCFQNPNADEDTMKLAARIAPKSPAAQSYFKTHPELAPKPSKQSAGDKEEAEEGSGLTIVETNQSKDVVAAAFDDPNPQSIIVGHGKLAFASDYDSDDDSLLSTTYGATQDNSTTMNYAQDIPAQDSTTSLSSSRRVKKSRSARIAINRMDQADGPHQINSAITDNVKQNSPSPIKPQPNDPARSSPTPNAGLTMSPYVMAFMFMLVAAASSAATLLVPRLFNQGGLAAANQGWQIPSLYVSTDGWLSSPEMHLVLYDSLGKTLAYWLLSEIAAAAIRTVLTWSYRLYLLLSQALLLARTRRRKVNNFFTHDFKANYILMSRGLAHALLHPWTSLLAFIHILLLACLMCPASRLLNLDSGPFYRYNARQHTHFRWTHRSWSLQPRVRLLLVSLLFTVLTVCDYPHFPHSPAVPLTSTASVGLICLLDPICFTGEARASSVQPLRPPYLNPRGQLRKTTLPQYTRHISRALLSLNNDASSTSQKQCSHSSLRRKLIIDSGASFHVHHDSKDLVNLKPCSNRIMGIDHQPHDCVSLGDMPIRARGEDGYEYHLVIKNVRYAPTFKDSLISINQLWLESKVDVSFKDVCCLITPCGKKFPFDKPKGTGLYAWRVQGNASMYETPTKRVRFADTRIASSQSESAATRPATTSVQTTSASAMSFQATHSSKSLSHIASLAPDTAARHMHRRLHLGSRRMSRLPSLTADAPENLSRAKVGACPSCVTANSTHHPHRESKYEESTPGRLIHADIAGPFIKSMVGHYEYLLVLVDDHSRFKFGIPLVKRSDAPAQIRSFIASFNSFASRTGATVQPIGTLHTDGAGEFTSGKFRDELADINVHKTESPTEIHALNGVAERAIKSIFAHVRSDLVASGAPKSFWPFAVAHAIDILNRTTCPPHDRHTCYESLTGDKPRIMSLWPWGCRAYSVRPSSQRSKTNLDSMAWEGMHLGRSTAQPGSYLVWIPTLSKVVSSSDVYMDECYMPWRKAGDRHISDPIPVPADGDAGQPPTLPAVTLPESSASSQPAGSISAEFDRVARANNPTLSTPSAQSARLSRRVLVLFSGPYSRPDGLIAFLLRMGLQVTALDNDGGKGGNPAHDILNNNVYENILRRSQRGEFLAVFAAPPCSTFSICRFTRSSSAADGGPPVVRRRSGGQVTGITNCPAAHRREVKQSNELVARTCAILHAAVEAGSEFAMENPADRGNVENLSTFVDADHAPIWLMPDILRLSKFASCRYSTFPMCAFGVDYEKPTTLMYTPGLAKHLQDLDHLRCTHEKGHDGKAGGEKVDGVWNSAAAAAYPAELNLWLAQAIAHLATAHREIPPHPLVSQRMNGGESLVFESDAPSTSRPIQTPIPNQPVRPEPSTPRPSRPELPDNLPKPSAPEPEPVPDPPDADTPSAPQRSTPAPTKKKPRWYTESSDVIARRTRSNRGSDGSGLFTKALLSAYEEFQACGNAFVVQTDGELKRDPKNHDEAMADDSSGWLKAETEELKNHQDNGSFQLIDRSVFESEAPNRRLVKLVWVYKRKRSGRMKARLCVQGCTQQPGVDFDQTHCATMRGTSLRLLSALAGQHGLSMRRWDFVSAFLQGDLEQGEVVYCSPPPGPHGKIGSDGRQRIWKVKKPVYGMAQAGRRWQRTLFPWLIQWGLKPCSADPCVFMRKETVQTPNGPRDDILLVGCYVDDLFVLYNNGDKHSLYHRFTTDLQRRWSVDDEGEVSDLLNVEMYRVDGGVELRQTSYIDRLAKEWLPDGIPSNIHINSAPHTECLPDMVLQALSSTEQVDLHLLRRYQSLVGSLLYAATNTRPDIAYAVGMLCRAMGKPTPELFEAALRVVAYLSHHRYIGLRYECDQKPLAGMSDADWAVRHSTSGHVFSMSKAAISWGSKKQPTIALSSCESEIMAASEAAKEAVYLDRFVEELGFKDDADPIHLSLDNKAAIDSSYNPENHSRTKHIDRRHYFIRELVEEGRIVVPFVSSEDNLADFFTKPLKPVRFFVLRDKIMNVR